MVHDVSCRWPLLLNLKRQPPLSRGGAQWRFNQRSWAAMDSRSCCEPNRYRCVKQRAAMVCVIVPSPSALGGSGSCQQAVWGFSGPSLPFGTLPPVMLDLNNLSSLCLSPVIMQRVIFRSLPILHFCTQHVIWNVSTETFLLIFNRRVWPCTAWDEQARAILKTLLKSSVTVCSVVTARRCEVATHVATLVSWVESVQ